MKKQEKIERIIEILEDKYPDPPIPLKHKDPFTLLIAVLLSAQCTDERVNKVTPELFKKADNPFDMIKLEVKTIQGIIRPCGLSPRKAKSIYELSQILIDQHDGQVPEDFEALEALPGVGHKTASVVMAQSFNIPSVPIDTHIHRLMERWGLSNGKNVVKTEDDFKKCFPIKLWNKLHLQIIYFGREFCKARQHTPEDCPICSWAMSKKLKKEQAGKSK